jgi:uncharacterized protein
MNCATTCASKTESPIPAPILHSMNRSLILIALVCFCPLLQAQKKVPELWGQRIHDEAKVLSASAADNLERQLKNFEDSTSNQIAVLIVPSLDGETIEGYAIRVATEWKLGQANNDNGVLLLISTGDRKVRIEVGQGLEGVLTDALSSRIIRNEIAPNFRRGDYEAGVVAAVDAIIKATKGEYKADNVSSKRKRGGGTGAFGLIIFAVLGVFTYTALFAKGCAGWGTYGVLAPFYFFLPGVALGSTGTGFSIFIAYLIGFPILKLLFARTAWGQAIARQMEQSSKNRRGGGGWSSGGGWFMGGGGGSWGGGGGGGFSGGGGSFGGGGSSGSW